MQPDRRGRHTQEKRHGGERLNHSSRREQKEKVREDSACWNICSLPCDRTCQSNCPGSQCAVVSRTRAFQRSESSGSQDCRTEVMHSRVLSTRQPTDVSCDEIIFSQSRYENDPHISMNPPDS